MVGRFTEINSVFKNAFQFNSWNKIQSTEFQAQNFPLVPPVSTAEYVIPCSVGLPVGEFRRLSMGSPAVLFSESTILLRVQSTPFCVKKYPFSTNDSSFKESGNYLLFLRMLRGNTVFFEEGRTATFLVDPMGNRYIQATTRSADPPPALPGYSYKRETLSAPLKTGCLNPSSKGSAPPNKLGVDPVYCKQLVIYDTGGNTYMLVEANTSTPSGLASFPSDNLYTINGPLGSAPYSCTKDPLTQPAPAPTHKPTPTPSVAATQNPSGKPLNNNYFPNETNHLIL
jgi:hypothetical protein